MNKTPEETPLVDEMLSIIADSKKHNRPTMTADEFIALLKRIYQEVDHVEPARSTASRKSLSDT